MNRSMASISGFLSAGALAFLAGCAGNPAAVPPSPRVSLAAKSHPDSGIGYKTLFEFPESKPECLPDGAWPMGALIAVNGIIYGTTSAGGGDDDGTVFAITTKGRVQPLYSFQNLNGYGGAPGGPFAGVVAIGSNLYGTVPDGGTNGDGFVYSLGIYARNAAILHDFGSSLTDGRKPRAALIVVDGALYGTTYEGGAYGGGTVFRINANTGKERILYNFRSAPYDGQNPSASLLALNGKLYGSTYAGGQYGDGTVFSVDMTTGKERILHSFSGEPDGQWPYSALIDVGGALYGTTTEGGSYGYYSAGTVFRIDPSGKNERVLHSFGGGYDGREPYAPLLDVNGTLYGTTGNGGANYDRCQYSCGTLFKIDPSTGKEKVLHSFGIGLDGAYPIGGMLELNGKVYGTTMFGGVLSGCVISGSVTIGTVFVFRP
jgi:uncharacterized repeat protein (TIGR03803 family)